MSIENLVQQLSILLNQINIIFKINNSVFFNIPQENNNNT